MKCDFVTFGVITSVINILSFFILCFNMKLNKNIREFKLWIIGNGLNSLGVLLLIVREISSNQFITVVVGNELIILGTICIYIGIMRFVNEKVNYRMITLSYVAFTIVYIYLTYFNDNIVLRIIVFSFFISIYIILAGLIILKNKDYYLKPVTNFLGGVLLIQGFFFAIRGSVKFASIYLNSILDTSILEISLYIMAITMSPLISFALILMINQKLSEETRVARERLQLIFDTTPDSIIITSLESGIIVEANDKFVNITGFSKEEIIGETTTNLGLWNDSKQRQELLEILKENHQCENFEMLLRRKDGSIITWSLSARLMDFNGIQHIISVSRDISSCKIVEHKLKQSEEKYRLLIENSFESISVAQDGKLKFCNEMATVLMGYSEEELRSIPFIEFIYHDDREVVMTNHLKILRGENAKTRYQYRVLRKDSQIRWVEINSVLIEWEGKAATLNFQTDITKRKKYEEEILYLSYHDELTGLYNRRFYEEELKRLDVEKNLPLTLIIGDVNGLKLINDAFGHLKGDKLIKEIADTLKKECSGGEILARIGGDEFVILCPKTESIEAEKIVRDINKSIGNKKLDNMILSISFGWGTKCKVNKEVAKTYMEAEEHMYKNKLFESNYIKKKTIKLISETFYEQNEVEQNHCENVSKICENIGIELGLSLSELKQLKVAGILHDIGKVGINKQILNKLGKLDENEWLEIKRHPEIGYQILRSVNEFSNIAEFVLAQHERWDGNGYPKGLKAEEIPLIARVIAIADAYDSMTNESRYGNPLSYESVLEELQKNSGSQFDPELVSVFIEKVLGKAVNYK
ncbi:MAG: PAS domain S-box protein [Clostridium sp.]